MSNYSKTLVLGSVLAAATMASSAALAEVSSDLTISSMYLWRGIDISDGKPALSSTVQYDHESGFYVGSWFSSEGTPAYGTEFVSAVGTPPTITSGEIALGGTNGSSYEIDLYFGYGGSVGDFGYSLGWAGYYYPEALGGIGDSDLAEYIVGASYKDLSLTAYINTEPKDNDHYKYYSLDYSYGAYGFHYGSTTVKDGDGYTDINVSYAFNDALTWTISKASGDAIEKDSPQEDPIVMVSYSVPLK